MTNFRQSIRWLVVLVAFLVCWYAIAQYFGTPAQTSVSPPASGVTPPGSAYAPPPPPLTASDMISAQPATGFQFLISYTDRGFEPLAVQVNSGDTVRFTNNSHAKLWVAASGDPIYPATANGCGSSALDSCEPLDPGQYWQFTFTKTGTWTFSNNLDKSEAGTVVVQVK